MYYILCPSFSISIFVNKKGLLPWYMRCDLVNKVLLVLLPFLICCLWCCCHCYWLGQDPGWDSARSPAPLPCLWSHHARTTPRWRYEYQYWCQKQQQNGCGLEKQSFFQWMLFSVAVLISWAKNAAVTMQSIFFNFCYPPKIVNSSRTGPFCTTDLTKKCISIIAGGE